VEADRLEHMQIPQAQGYPIPANQAGQPPPPPRLRRPRPPRPPNNYDEELTQRRRQERADEALARRLQRVNLENADNDDDYQGGIGDIHGVGNAADHFMNQDYIRAAHNILTGNYNQANAAANYVMGVAQARGAPPPQRRMADRYPVPQAVRPPSPPLMRRHTVREQAYNAAPNTRSEERVVPQRARRDYASEAAVHDPAGRAPPQRTASAREPSASGAGPRHSVLAGLGGARRGNRVDAWRTHVEPGVEPPEGMLSV
jgi:hypothetical protein